ncbi:MAG: hypothetical protein K0T99_02255 [Alphaproteobacteria bacterium]|nr:hypothetical protein [Alphaproteobacteria bacterium]
MSISVTSTKYMVRVKNTIRVFSEKSSIKEDVIVDEEGKHFICMEVGKMKYCTTLDKPDVSKSSKSNFNK